MLITLLLLSVYSHFAYIDQLSLSETTSHDIVYSLSVIVSMLQCLAEALQLQ